tara:strand:+ start:515 stop:709 length:195 start_codon:yes stop_codon:yes gene_type:complete
MKEVFTLKNYLTGLAVLTVIYLIEVFIPKVGWMFLFKVGVIVLGTFSMGFIINKLIEVFKKKHK